MFVIMEHIKNTVESAMFGHIVISGFFLMVGAWTIYGFADCLVLFNKRLKATWPIKPIDLRSLSSLHRASRSVRFMQGGQKIQTDFGFSMQKEGAPRQLV